MKTNTFTKNLKFCRKLNGLTQVQFAKQLSMKRSNVGAYEEGRAEPSIKQFLEICKFYNVDPNEFYNNEFTDENVVKI